MNRQILSVVWPLIVINILALGLWLASCRWSVVLIGPPGRRLREIGSRGSGHWRKVMRAARSMRESMRPTRALQAMRTTVSTLATSVSRTVTRPSAKKHTPPAEGLDAWIDEVEQQETRAADQRPEPATEAVVDAAEGSAAWWKAFADSGGALPGAAETCRREDAAADRKTAIF